MLDARAVHPKTATASMRSTAICDDGLPYERAVVAGLLIFLSGLGTFERFGTESALEVLGRKLSPRAITALSAERMKPTY